MRVDWDNSRAVLGNFNTNFTGTEFAQYNRTLYGASVAWHGLESTGDGEAKTNLDAFVSEVQTALGHDEFLGTGGSLYYLRHTDVVEGSAKARVEIVDRVTERTLENLTLVEGVDYELDELQGRVILAKPLSQVARQRAPYLVRENALEGNRVVLVMDYEYLPIGFADDAASFGLRGKKWLGDHVALGGTWVDESRDTQDYLLAGADLTLQAGRGSFVKFEYAQTEATQSARYFSQDGGLSFSALNPLTAQSAADDRTGEGFGVEARMNLRERGLTERDATLAAWWNRNDDQFAVARRDEGFAVERTGVEAIGSVTEHVRLALRATTDRARRHRARPGLERRPGRRCRPPGSSPRATGFPARCSTSTRKSTRRGGRGGDAGRGRVPAHDQRRLAGLGHGAVRTGRQRAGRRQRPLHARLAIRVQPGVVGGRRGLERRPWRRPVGDARVPALAIATRSTAPSAIRSTAATIRCPRTRPCPASRASARAATSTTTSATTSRSARAGSCRTRPASSTRRSSSIRRPRPGIGHVFGLEFMPRTGWRYGLSLQKGEFATQGGATERDAVSGSVGYAGRRFNWTSRLEFRDDSGVTEAAQYLSSNRVDFKFRDSFRLLGKLNYSKTEQDVARLNDGRLFFGQAASDAQFAEASVGVAYRPTDHDRFNWLAKALLPLRPDQLCAGRCATRRARASRACCSPVAPTRNRWSAPGRASTG